MAGGKRTSGGGAAKSNSGKQLEPRDISFLDTLHPRHVCWILSVAAGLKPSAIIESVDAAKWKHFVELLERLGLCFVYASSERVVVGLRRDQIDAFGGHKKPEAGERAYLSFDNDNWQKALRGKPTHFDTHDKLPVDLAPVVYKGMDVQEFYISNQPARLMDLSLSRNGGWRDEWDAKSAGKALGYPSCCIDSYFRLGSNGVAPRHQFFMEAIEKGMDQSMPIEFWSIFHVPCSTSCQPSIELGRAYIEAVRGYSNELFNSVVRGLHCSHLAWSVSERFQDYDPAPEDSYRVEPKRKQAVIERTEKMLGSPVTVELGVVKRPFLYIRDEHEGSILHLTPRVVGPKWICYSPGNGVLIQDVATDEVFCFLRADILGQDLMRFRDSVFRVYRSS
jgi:hypothetical protein